MISVTNQFEEDNLIIQFSGETIEAKTLTISIINDVNFKPVIDYLIQIIPKNTKLESSFEDFSEQGNGEKLALIKETIEEIYEEFNLTLKSLNEQVKEQSKFEELPENQSEGEDLPF